jgi:hypothetical protein
MNSDSGDRSRSGEQTPVSTGEYAVGYGKPPPEHRFRQGQSGNSKGRPRGSVNEATTWKKLLLRTVTITEGGRTRKISMIELLCRKLIEHSLKGNVKTSTFILNRFAAMMSDNSAPDISDDDREVLNAFLRKQGLGIEEEQ